MNIVSDGTTTLPGGAVVDGIENINWAFSANPTTAIDASDFVGSTHISMTGFAAAVNNINGQLITFDKVTIENTDTLTVAAGVHSLAVELNAVKTGSFVEANETKAGDLTDLSVKGSTDAGGTLTIETNATKLGSLSLELTSKTTVDVFDLLTGLRDRHSDAQGV